MLPESILWSYAIQLTGALRVIHAAGLSCRCLDASKVIITNRNRVRLSGVCVFDVILYDHSPANRLQLTSHFQVSQYPVWFLVVKLPSWSNVLQYYFFTSRNCVNYICSKKNYQNWANFYSH